MRLVIEQVRRRHDSVVRTSDISAVAVIELGLQELRTRRRKEPLDPRVLLDSRRPQSRELLV